MELFKKFGKQKEIKNARTAACAQSPDLLNNQKKEMKEGIDELGCTTVKEIMIPRVDTVFVDVSATQEALAEVIKENGLSRYPVYEETIDNVVGILYSKDVLKAVLNRQPFDVAQLMRKPYFIPESKRIDSLLLEFKRRRVHIAVAVDEYGGVSGIVCMEDILEEIVGDIQDEFDNEEEAILEISPDVFICDARVNIEDLNERCRIELPYEDFDTLGGFVFDHFGKIPVKYEKVEWNHIDFIIQEMDHHKINSVKLIIKRNGGAAHET